ncbi:MULTISPECIES: phosphotransferase [unclassified Coleofasciculus]|uniref:phosphotransferase n=1 Tax=unclassified Coleofasciculus TaxID=2692782 RepID=UPI001882D9BA|nr:MULTISPECIES: phosphotransferase [unclassified Coleofasciculus]MBE9124866.1 phosphotransferase [Coleofasciculus sp. LEGE 07081]MBE9147890.1 phosphotransferase [Coleofasciculus sp. LEGE 07092]
MSTFAVKIYKNTHSNKPPAIHLPSNLPHQELMNGELITVAQELFEENGVLVINHLFSKELISQFYQGFVARYQTYFEDQDYDDALKVGDKRQMLTVDFQEPFNHPTVYGNPLLLSLMKGLLGPDFVLGSFGAVISLPGALGQHIHRDHPPLFEDEALTLNLPSFAITVVVPLVDLTPETGSTRLWKGSHRVSCEQKMAMKDSSIPLLSTGSCYLMDYQLLHGGTPNVSNLVRPILYIIYYRSWFQEAVNYEQQSRLSITQREYDKVPQSYKFLFVRQREILRANHSLEPQLRQSPTQKNFVELTSKEQAQQLKKLAKTVLPQYGFKQADVQLISHGDNTVFSVKGSRMLSLETDLGDCPTAPNHFILRIHRSHYLSPAAIESELHWLTHLHHKTQIRVPVPLPTLEKTLYSSGQVLGISEPRICSLTGWVKGRSLVDLPRAERSQPQTLIAIGRLLGTLHHHAAQWSVPGAFTRPCWNWNGLFGKGAGYSDDGDRVWELTPQPYRRLFESVSAQVKTVMASLGEDKEQFGLIHGDFWLGNLLIHGEDIGVIDFADCGFGYWGYDLARFLNDFSTDPQYSNCLDHLLHGYTQVRTFPEAQLPHLKLFLAAQQVTLALWRVNRAQDHPDFRSTLVADLEETAEAVDVFLTAFGA